MENEWSIHEVARLTGTTSRALRHYGEIGLLHPSRTGTNGYRHYDSAALTRLQRILLLRDLGLGLAAIRDVLNGATDDAEALAGHLRWLREEKNRIDRQIATIQTTVRKLEEGEDLMAEDMFDGFDHTRYQNEVEQRWGADAYAAGDAWWRSMTDVEKEGWMIRQQQLAADWATAARSGAAPGSTEAQALAHRHFLWLASVPGTPRGASAAPTSHAASTSPGLSKEYFVGLGEMYVADERFAANYGGVEGATFVRDAMRIYAESGM
ncbi:DNA-binding transcriptional MerR regulator [Glaciihabitans tibetensis]|uniref:DNA-binding transcriptional MerR regulator n=1 Tax=Glaciihabitans tibetensis TaxID=1266600 RepID=A0A2T0VDB5_9MICO|nr:MerR family transcriptional regulator [Glaciihabitans tibetensis]PRY68160.1 DNA-binding transcriptional MerR regulator [Glaciihabitans tibetensis]